MSPSALNAMYDIYKSSLRITTTGGYNFSTLCIRYGEHCFVRNILEIWRYQETPIRHLSESDILSSVNQVTISELDVSNMLGDKRNGTNGIISAKAAKMTWVLKGDSTIMSESKEWEQHMIYLAKRGHSNLSQVYIYASRTVADEGGGAMQSSIYQLSGGYCLIPTKRQINGVGVDNIFVINETLSSFTEEEKQKLPLPAVVSKILKHAGVSITVTSFTDILAFGTGATTIIPALRSFCVFAVLAIMALLHFLNFNIGYLITELYRNLERVKSTLSEMGVAVFNGGFSTFLAFIVVAFSKSYVFTTFFKVFFLIVLFGLFHGLVYLPILLSLFGPKPYQSAYTTDVIVTYEKGDPVLEKSQTETTCYVIKPNIMTRKIFYLLISYILTEIIIKYVIVFMNLCAVPLVFQKRVMCCTNINIILNLVSKKITFCNIELSFGLLTDRYKKLQNIYKKKIRPKL
ncbi:hypothetical protein KUTeg_016954 [Tegillarca granosa]|uniref:SSD domain-containing protein n=1 Tax=Tegillarca granosa TaxID=220873 RepID=A0ABQ9EMB2_TEGGR|nr:hypothetical protein KUTeg_016954 [Tegillarca granosa]